MLPTEPTKPKDSLSDLTILLYGQPKIGKSTWCSQAPNTVFLDTEGGLNSLSVYKVATPTWETICSACAEIAKGEHKFGTVAIDTIENAYKYASDYVCNKLKISHPGDMDYGKGYEAVSTEFMRVIGKLALLPYGLILVSHAKEKEINTRTGKVVKAQPNLPGSVMKVVSGFVDLILYCDMESVMDDEGNKKDIAVLHTKPSAAFDAGDRTGRLPEALPLQYAALADAFSKRKDKK